MFSFLIGIVWCTHNVGSRKQMVLPAAIGDAVLVFCSLATTIRYSTQRHERQNYFYRNFLRTFKQKFIMIYKWNPLQSNFIPKYSSYKPSKNPTISIKYTFFMREATQVPCSTSAAHSTMQTNLFNWQAFSRSSDLADSPESSWLVRGKRL